MVVGSGFDVPRIQTTTMATTFQSASSTRVKAPQPLTVAGAGLIRR